MANATGTVGTADVNNVVVTCSPQSFTVGGSIAGLSVGGLVLANGTDRLLVSSGATSFTMPQLNQNGVSGTPGTGAVGNAPGGRFEAASWQDSNGRFWLFGGGGYDLAGSSPGALADLWMFDPTALTPTWTWEGGSNTSAYGTMGTPATNNLPGARGGSVVWTDSTGQVWLFGGLGYGATPGVEGLLNDLWNYNPTTQQWTWVNGTQVANSSAVAYGTPGTPALMNQPGGRAAASGWVDSTGHLWMFGGNGYDSAGNVGDLNDLWKF